MSDERKQRERCDRAARLFLRLERAFEARVITFGKMRGRELLADARDDLRHVGSAVGVGEHDDAPAGVLAQDLVRSVGLADLGDLPRRYPAARRFDQEIAQASAWCEDGLGAAAPRRSGGSRPRRARPRGRSTIGSAARPPPPAARRTARRAYNRRGFRAAGCAPASRPAGRRGPECPRACRRSSSASCASVSRSSPNTLRASLGADAGQHVVEPVRDRLADIDRNRQHGEARADIGGDLRLGA